MFFSTPIEKNIYRKENNTHFDWVEIHVGRSQILPMIEDQPQRETVFAKPG